MNYFKHTILFASLLGIGYFNAFSQKIPSHYAIQFQSGFNKISAEFEHQNASVTKAGSGNAIKLSGDSIAYRKKKNFNVGEFVLFTNINIAESAPNDSLALFAFEFAKKDSGNFYRLKIVRQSELLILVLDGKQWGKSFELTSAEIDPQFIPENGWFKLAVKRDILLGSIEVWLHESKLPIVELSDRKHVLGGMTFKAQNIQVLLDNLKIYSPASLENLEEL